MKTYYYYKALRRTITQFLDLFNDIKIARYDVNGSFLKNVVVPLKYAPKEKIWIWLNERHDDEMLPQMAVTLTGVEYSLERQTNKHFRITDCTSADESSISRYLNPIPYDLNFQLGIWSLYMYDVDQILEQILPYFQPYIYMRVGIPELSSTFETKVLFNSASPDIETEYADEGRRILKYTLDFTVQTFLFKPIEVTGLIRTILANFYMNESTWNTAFADTDSTFTSAASGESMRLIGPSADDPSIYTYEIFQLGERVDGVLKFGD